MCCDYTILTERFGIGNLDQHTGVYQSQLNGTWQAITIGSRSHVDRCYVMGPGVHRPPRINPSTTEPLIHYELPVAAHLVSVERPFVGVIEGPVIVMPAMAEEASGTTDPSPSVIANLKAILADIKLAAHLDLNFYRNCPPFLPTKRAPFSYARRWSQFGTTGIPTTESVTIPGFGRKSCSLSIEAQGISAGTFTWSMIGINSVSNDAAVFIAGPGTPISITQDLQAVTPVSANFQNVYFFDGEFDAYQFTITETVALNAGVTIDIVFKSWD